MLTKEQMMAAVRYNSGRIMDGLDIFSLPLPWRELTGIPFAQATFDFQFASRLTTDGKLGPLTEKAIRKTSDNTPVDRPVAKIIDDLSNAIIVNGARVMLPCDFVSAGITASNYLDDGEPHFKFKNRKSQLIHFVLHETCGNTAKGCKDTLLKRGYGAQLIMAPSGHISCHGDLVTEQMIHANHLNSTSFGIEVVNPYAPKLVRDKAIFSNMIPAEWWTWCPDKKDRRYVTPTPTQMYSIRLLAPWLCGITGVPYRFPTRGLNARKRSIDGLTLKPKAKPGPGIVAHQDFASHADGRYMLEDLIRSAE